MPRARAYQSADDAMITSILADAGRLIAVDGSLTCNGDGYLVADKEDPTALWDADGLPWQSRVYCSAPGKFKLVLEEWGTGAK